MHDPVLNWLVARLHNWMARRLIRKTRRKVETALAIIDVSLASDPVNSDLIESRQKLLQQLGRIRVYHAAAELQRDELGPPR